MVRSVEQTQSSRRRTIAWISAAALSTVAACFAGPTFVVQQYSGAQRPTESIAILRVNQRDPARLLLLDDQDASAPLIAEDSRLHVEVLPGRHTVAVANVKAPSERYLPVSFDAEAGRVYRVTFPSGPTGDARVFEVERGNDALVRDVTLEEKPKPATRPTPREDAGAPATAPVQDDAAVGDAG